MCVTGGMSMSISVVMGVSVHMTIGMVVHQVMTVRNFPSALRRLGRLGSRYGRHDTDTEDLRGAVGVADSILVVGPVRFFVPLPGGLDDRRH